MTFLSTKAKAAVIIVAAVLVLAVGLVSARARDAAGPPDEMDGGAVVLARPMERPSFRLTTTDGARFDFAAQTAGKTALLYFGYLNCPDICPLHLSNIASALRNLTPEERAQVMTVFVTVDPGRDEPDEIRRYLDRFHPDFIGLTGTTDELVAAQRAAGVPVAVLGEPDGNGNYDVGHAAQVIAYGPDGPAWRVYPFGSTLDDWQRDLPLLIRGELP